MIQPIFCLDVPAIPIWSRRPFVAATTASLFAISSTSNRGFFIEKKVNLIEILLSHKINC